MLLLAGDPAGDGGGYSREARQAYLQEALDAVRTADQKTLTDAASYVGVMERNACRSDFRRLRVQCLIEAATRNCRGFKDRARRRRCALYSDIIVSNTLSEKALIDDERRYQIMQENRDYRRALRRELSEVYGNLAADFRLSPHYTCTRAEPKCLAAAVDSYCDERADRQNLSWQYCAAALVWFIGTAR